MIPGELCTLLLGIDCVSTGNTGQFKASPVGALNVWVWDQARAATRDRVQPRGGFADRHGPFRPGFFFFTSVLLFAQTEPPAPTAPVQTEPTPSASTPPVQTGTHPAGANPACANRTNTVDVNGPRGPAAICTRRNRPCARRRQRVAPEDARVSTHARSGCSQGRTAGNPATDTGGGERRPHGGRPRGLSRHSRLGLHHAGVRERPQSRSDRAARATQFQRSVPGHVRRVHRDRPAKPGHDAEISGACRSRAAST